MARLTIKDLEKRLSPLAVQVAYALVENDFTKHDERKTMQEIADDLGISRTTLYNHKNDGNVIRLMGMLSDKQTDTMRAKVDNALMRLIDDGSGRHASIKAIELFYKLKGLMIDRSIVGESEEDVAPRITQAELDEELRKLEDLL
ncbi:phBC6A51 family helix-turn-helix protein [Fictibacillus phosphorivorans]|uniref:phBC6A51 family helix-turn-helix protein n=1 Tax=Fictibacillus phosphorivorans TaxID=1221500 RepID=UPI003CF7CA7E